MSPTVTHFHRRGLTLGWIWLAACSLVAAGLMALLLASSRTPFIQRLIDNPALFKVALVVHVDLSVLIWFFACAGALWSWLAPDRRNALDRAALAVAVTGTVMITAAPLVGAAGPLMNNYVPVLRHPWFFIGLTAVAGGTAAQAVRFLWTESRTHRPAARSPNEFDLLRSIMALTAVVILATFACVLLSYLRMPAGATGEQYFELLFWGGGHVLQFAYTLMLLGGWLVLAGAARSRLPVARGRLDKLLRLAAVPLIALPWLYAAPLESFSHLHGFTELMRWGGLACLPVALISVRMAFAATPTSVAEHTFAAAAFWSMVLFAAGGVLGFLISGSNTMIPAHYHGSIVAVTLALMGLLYWLLPALDCPIRMPTAARWQPSIYAAGQLLHVAGLAWSGGYGVQRKVAGAAQGLDGLGETAAMGLMGLGGLISVIGGVMFLCVVISALIAGQWHAPAKDTAPSAALS